MKSRFLTKTFATVAAALILSSVAVAAAINGPLNYGDSVPEDQMADASLFVGVTLYGFKLVPGQRYNAEFFAYDSEDDPYPYLLGNGTMTARANGTVTFPLELGDFLAYKNRIHELVACVTTPTWPFTVIQNAEGKYACAYYEFERGEYEAH